MKSQLLNPPSMTSPYSLPSLSHSLPLSLALPPSLSRSPSLLLLITPLVTSDLYLSNLLSQIPPLSVPFPTHNYQVHHPRATDKENGGWGWVGGWCLVGPRAVRHWGKTMFDVWIMFLNLQLQFGQIAFCQ